VLISTTSSNASSGGLGSFGVLSPNNVPSLYRIISEGSKKEGCMGFGVTELIPPDHPIDVIT
jgi:hypothetical protein